MTENKNKQFLKISIVISLIASVVVYLLATKILKYAYTENPEYANWQRLSDKAKDLKTEDGKPVHSMPGKQIPLTQNEIVILSAGLAFFAPLSAFPICYFIFRRRGKQNQH